MNIVDFFVLSQFFVISRLKVLECDCFFSRQFLFIIQSMKRYFRLKNNHIVGLSVIDATEKC